MGFSITLSYDGRSKQSCSFLFLSSSRVSDAHSFHEYSDWGEIETRVSHSSPNYGLLDSYCPFLPLRAGITSWGHGWVLSLGVKLIQVEKVSFPPCQCSCSLLRAHSGTETFQLDPEIPISVFGFPCNA